MEKHSNDMDLFFSMPKPHHYVWKIVLIVMVLIVLGLACSYLAASLGPKSVPAVKTAAVPVAAGLTNAQRMAIMDAPQPLPPQAHQLTDAQRAAIMNGKASATTQF
jgi:hypothetical protein